MLKKKENGKNFPLFEIESWEFGVEIFFSVFFFFFIHDIFPPSPLAPLLCNISECNLDSFVFQLKREIKIFFFLMKKFEVEQQIIRVGMKYRENRKINDGIISIYGN